MDRASSDNEWTSCFPKTTVLQLTRMSSDHCLLLISADKDVNDHIKYFKFLNFWAEPDGFYELVRQMWSEEISRNSFWIVHKKLKS